jgi:hypothetical protein
MRKEKIEINKIRNKNGEMTTTTKKYKESPGTILKTFNKINWKILKKWTNF